MPTRLFVISSTVLLALAAIYFQQPLYGFLSPGPIVVDHTREITYVGHCSAASIEHFENIFYAEPPTGQLRFAPPIPLNPARRSVIDATRSGAWCPQGTGDILPFTSTVTNISENCLSLRISRSRGAKPDDKLPVVVWIHGGGHALGSASDILYEPDGLLKRAVDDGRPVIYAGINYRLGIFGFATSKTLVERKETNVGLRDQRAALEWIRDNIEAFGGDPNRITVVGQSVGASDIGLQLLAFGGTNDVPFQQAMMMSGGPTLNFNSDPDQVTRNTADIARQVGCIAAQSDGQDPETLECLRHTPLEVLTNRSVTASRAARPPFGEAYFYPTIDGDFLLDRPSQLVRAGKFTKGIPLIASWVTNDGAWYASPATSMDDEVLASFGLWLNNLSASTKQALLELYPLTDFEHMVRPDIDGPISPQYYRAAQLNRDIWFTCPVLDFTWHYSHPQYGGVSASQVRVYEFNQTRYTPAFENMGVPMWRVAHLSDIPFFFNNGHLVGGADNSEEHLELGKRFASTILRFVYEGSLEGGGERETWPAAFEDNQAGGTRGGPDSISIKVFGCPDGSLPVTVGKDPGSSMDALSGVEQAVRWEKLFSRCELINGQQFREEAGV
ncbi:Alpha/Beta hydrolase protein [Aspergillus karnatakaensis]|uniref:Alpha/Beta hydrolase protein n=1 Tax=Aspergillus karnatakaensis TaxID=1810916 RepID=UPI003CCD9CC0